MAFAAQLHPSSVITTKKKKFLNAPLFTKTSPQWLPLYIFTLDVLPSSSQGKFVSPKIFHLLGTFANQYNVDNFFFFASALHPVCITSLWS